MQKKVISIKVSKEELEELDSKASEAGLSRSDYIRCHLMDNNNGPVICKSKEFYQSLHAISNALNVLESKSPKINTDDVRREIVKAWQLLN